MRTFTESELIDFLKSKMSYSQDVAERMTDLVFKARKPGAKDLKPRKKRKLTAEQKEFFGKRKFDPAVWKLEQKMKITDGRKKPQTSWT